MLSTVLTFVENSSNAKGGLIPFARVCFFNPPPSPKKCVTIIPILPMMRLSLDSGVRDRMQHGASMPETLLEFEPQQ